MRDQNAHPASEPARLVRGLLWFLFGLLIWAACTGLQGHDALAAIPVAFLFAWLGITLIPAHERIRLRAIPAFSLYFIHQSIRAGIHVAYLALHPWQRVSPRWIALDCTLPAGAPQALFAILVSLLPGTLCGEIEHNVHHIHLLTGTLSPEADLRELERRVGRLFGANPDLKA